MSAGPWLSIWAVVLLVAPVARGEASAGGVAAREAERDRTVWSDEVEAQRYGATITKLWDRLLFGKDKVRALRKFHFGKLKLGSLSPSKPLGWGVSEGTVRSGGRTLEHAGWARLLSELQDDGYALHASEWHHTKFGHEHDKPHSEYHVVLQLLQASERRVVVIEAEVGIDWSDDVDEEGLPIPGQLTVDGGRWYERRGDPPFQRVFSLSAEAAGQVSPSQGTFREPQPLLAQDLDKNGFVDIVIPNWNLVLENHGEGHFKRRPLLTTAPGEVGAAILADFTGDGVADLVLAENGAYMQLFEGKKGGTFSERGITLLATRQKLEAPYVISAGDVDGDGLLDLWVAQYREPYTGGTMPDPYYDANDGYPAFLLKNEGHGSFSDITAQAHLADKRKRRTYSGSLADLDGDGDLDLLVVSDFAGVDLFINDGKGHFKDVSQEALGQTHLFGMGHTLADFDRDGHLDIYAIGMASTTARRLEAMGLGRSDMPEYNQMRMPMAYGNRMYLGRGGTKFEQPEFADQVARTGWSWGTTAQDFDLDGFVDLYVANGHKSGESSADYCTEFWRHDIYTRPEDFGRALEARFKERLRGYFDGETSWNGYEHNQLLMNRGGKGFVNLALLTAVGFEFDGRVVVGGDLDGDGRSELLLTSYGDQRTSALHVVSNRFQTGNHWIGVRLDDLGPGFSPFGATITLTTSEGRTVQEVTSGDSHSAQHAPVKVFGLGPSPTVETLEVRWPNGHTERISKPELDRYHELQVPADVLERARQAVGDEVGSVVRGPAPAEPEASGGSADGLDASPEHGGAHSGRTRLFAWLSVLVLLVGGPVVWWRGRRRSASSR